MLGQPPQPVGLGIFEYSDDIANVAVSGPEDTMGGSRGSKAGGKKRSDDDDAAYTTVMLRNIPNKYTRQMLIDQLHRAGFRGDIDYLYLPTDFANRCNVGYCFINMREASARARFVTNFDGVAAQSCLPGFNSYKICHVTRAKWQGREDNVRRLKSSPELMAQLATHTEWLPLLLDAEGNQEPFLCDDAVGVARGGGVAPGRRQMRKKNQAMMPGYPVMPGMEDWAFDFNVEEMGGIPMGRGRGGDRGGKRKGRGGGAASYQDMASAGFSGIPTMMSVPVMTEQGLQYIPYDAYDGSAGSYFLAYSPMAPEMMGMMPGGYGGWPMAAGMGYDGFGDSYGAAAGVWPRPAKGAQRGGRRKGSGSGGASGSNAPEPAPDMVLPDDDE